LGWVLIDLSGYISRSIPTGNLYFLEIIQRIQV